MASKISYQGMAGTVGNLTEENYNKWYLEYADGIRKQTGNESISSDSIDSVMLMQNMKGEKVTNWFRDKQTQFDADQKKEQDKRTELMAKGYLGLVNSGPNANFGSNSSGQSPFGFGRGSLLDFNKNVGGRKALLGGG